MLLLGVFTLDRVDSRESVNAPGRPLVTLSELLPVRAGAVRLASGLRMLDSNPGFLIVAV